MDYSQISAVKRSLFDVKYSSLNPEQREAVYSARGPLLILAGAGSGKTTVLVSRAAFLIRYGDAVYGKNELSEDELDTLSSIADIAADMPKDELEKILLTLAVDPAPAWSVLSITFTNKAANEMKSRLESELGDAAKDIWAGTFHHTCVRILRSYIERAGYSKNFTIYDTDDVKRQIAAIMKDFNISETALTVKAITTTISRYKENLEDPDDIPAPQNAREKDILRIYAEYQKRLKHSNALDFDDIIAVTVRILRNNSDVRDYYNNRFRYILVDEYQDTNPVQSMLISLLGGKRRNIMVVGDDDQSIYKFRGATIENILSFNKTYPDAKVVKLEQNYRSTSMILDAANSVISHNTGRLGKTLFTDKSGGETITIRESASQNDEAVFITDTIAEGVASTGRKYRDYAVLYRVNSLAANLETAFSNARIPYRVLGGLRFYDRKEIKDMLAYLSVISNPSDVVRLQRIINEPKRGIGGTTLGVIDSISQETGKSVFEILADCENYPQLTRSVNRLRLFADLITRFIEAEKKLILPELIEKVLDESGYLKMLESGGLEERDRLDNIKELISQAVNFTRGAEFEGKEATLATFLEDVSLVADVDKYDGTADAVVLMTIHSSKGLEFPSVFLPGFEETIFPSAMSVAEPGQLEEERRLAYVAITRAREKLYITNAKERLVFGRTVYNPPSRFVAEIPESVCDIVRLPASVRANTGFTPIKKYPPKISPTSEFAQKYTTASKDSPTVTAKAAPAQTESFAKGDAIIHAVFGGGIITGTTDYGGDVLYEVAFEKSGTKQIMGTYAKFKRKDTEI
ncbi:DNA helicase [Clostridia bacterium]|nr:DNA helicase [Clostridia bacterium]